MTIPTFLKTSLFSRMGRYTASVLALMGAAAFAPQPAAAVEVPEERTLDVLFVYTPEAERKNGSADGMRARGIVEVEYNNKVFENSKINGAHRLVGVRKVEYTEASFFEEDLDALTAKNDRIMDEVHEWRDEVAADIVCLMRATNAPGTKDNPDFIAAGLAWGLGTIGGAPDRAFSVIGPDANWSYPHEVGHNSGLTHAREQGGTGIFPYSFGYRIPDSKNYTIMAYGNDAYTNRIPHFSNPEVQFAGQDTGVAEGEPNAADAAKTINQTLPVMVKYRKFKPGVETPVISPAGGNYQVEQRVTITCATEDSIIRYTLDGSAVTSSSPIYTDSFELRYSATVKARGFKGNSIPSETREAIFRIVYPDTAGDVIFTPPAGVYEDSVTVSLTTPTPGATIRYTANGAEVTEESTAYTRPLTLKRDTTLKARAYKYRHNPSQETSAEYEIIVLPVAEKPIVTFDGDLIPPSQGGNGSTYNGPPLVIITPYKPGDIIRYSIDNSEVTEDSPTSFLYTAPFLVTRTTNIKARAWRPSHRVSDERVVPVTIRPVKVALPRILPNGGNYVNQVAVRLETDTPRAYLRYTLDGRNLPDKILAAENDLYPIFTPGTPIVLTQNTTLKVRGYDVDYLTSDLVESARFFVRTAESIRDEYGDHIAAGDAHSLFLNTVSGELTAAGRNNYGQLGNGNNRAQLTPVNIATNVSVVATSRDHTLFITKDSVLYATGRNDYGQLGDGSVANRNTPAPIATEVLLAAAGGYHTLFITNDGALHVTGRNEYGQLGNGGTTNVFAPITIVPDGVLLAAAGKFHSLYLLGDGKLYGMGRNSEGQLGQGNISNYRSPVRIAPEDVVTAIAAGASHSIYLTKEGKLYGTGSNAYGQLGRSPAGETGVKVALSPVLIASGVRTIASGDEHILYVNANGELYGLGANTFGQLGLDPATVKYSATPVKIANNAVSIGAGSGHTVYTATDGVLTTRYSLGDNLYGQLGNGTTSNNNTPGLVPEGPPATAPVLVPGTGSFENNVEVRVTGTDAGASVRYIILREGEADRDVTLESPAYGTPFTLNRSYTTGARDKEVVVVKVRAWLGNRVPSAQTVATYTLLPPVEHVTPNIILQPENQVVVAWHPTTFMVSASGAPAPTYQWYFNGNRIVGATASSYSIERTTAAHVGTYYVIATNGPGNDGSAKSNEVTLSLLNPPSITRQPVAQDIFEGGEIRLSVSIVSDSAIAYQWRRDGQDITGATGSVLTIQNARVSQSGNYDVVVSNAAGSLSSNRAVVNVRAQNGDPVILRQPLAPEFVWIGGSASLSVNASSPAQDPPTYQWYHNGVAIQNATSATYTITALTASHGGSYYVAITNSRRTVESETVTLNPQPPGGLQVTRPLPPLTEAGLGQPVTLSVDAVVNATPGEPFPELAYQWYFQGEALVGANTSSYNIGALTPGHLGDYSVSITSGPNRVTSGPTRLASVTAPVILTVPAENVLEGVAGGGVALSVQIETGGASLISYQWLIDGVEIRGANAATLQALTSGLYSVRVSNGAGAVSSEIAKVRIVGPPLIGGFEAIPATQGGKPSALFGFFDYLNKADPNAVSVIANDRVHFEVTLQGGDDPFHYTWLLDGVPLFDAPDSAAFDVTNINRDCTYAVKVRNSVGEAVSKTIRIRVVQPPSIVRHPVSLELRAGQSGILTVSAAGSGQLTYQWFKGGVPIKHAVLSSYTIANANTSAAGTYWVEVSNYSGLVSKSKEVDVRVSNTNPIAGGVSTSGSSAQVTSGNTGGSLQLRSANTGISTGLTASQVVDVNAPAVVASNLKSGTFSLAGNATWSGIGNATAPADLVEGLRIVLAGELADLDARTVTRDDSILEILSGRRLPNGSYVYERTSDSTATLSYAISYGDAENERIERGTILFSFDSVAGGTYILSGEYNGLTASGVFNDGVLTGLGDFTVEEK